MPPKRKKPASKKTTARGATKKPFFLVRWVNALRAHLSENLNVKNILKFIVLIMIWGGVLLTCVLGYFAYEIPDILRKADLRRYPAVVMEDREGRVFARYGSMHGDAVSVNALPHHLVQAFLAIEDRRFYDHGGVDFLGIARATLHNMLAGRVVQGGSTITQQLAKNLFLSNKRAFRRKIQELLLAFWLESKLSKDEILSAYLNRIYLGSGSYGVDAAAQIYFGKRAKDVNLYEAAVLAGLPKAPSRYSPLNDPKASDSRARVVLQAMRDARYISQTVEENVVNRAPLPTRTRPNAEGRYFADWVMEQLGGLIDEQDEDVIIRTTLDSNMQNQAESQLASMLAVNQTSGKISEGALVTLNNTGAVRALVGGRDYFKSNFNRATQAQRQPGSAFKPFVFLAALDKGISPNTMLEDAPLTIGKWRPQNFDNNYRGKVSMADALALSLNTATIRLARQTGIASMRNVAAHIGISTPLENNLSLALGTSEVKLIDMTAAYGVIANHGHAIVPYGIDEIRSKSGKVLYTRQATAMPQIVSGNAADTTRKFMEGAVQYGTAKRAHLGISAGGKTGTTQDYRDAWFIGFTDKLITGVWMGNDNNSPTNKITGGNLPAQLWHDTMASALNLMQTEPNATEATNYTAEQLGGITNFIDNLFSGNENVQIDHSYPSRKR